MSKKKSFKGLILPYDTPPRRSAIKRQLIFFDSLLMPSHDDIALVNDGEVKEKFPGAEIVWARRTPFPRSDDYSDMMQSFQSETIALQNRGLLQFLSPTTHGLDPASNWLVYHSAISVPELVCAAVPDASTVPPSIAPHDGVYTGMTMSMGGHKSKYELPTHNPHDLSDVHEQWGGIAQGRLGRFVKFIRRCNFESAAPIALDSINSSLLRTMNSQPIITQNQNEENAAQAAISMDVVDPLILDQALVDMSWNEVLEIRRLILPKISIVREELIKRVSRINPGTGNVSLYQQSLQNMHDELDRYNDELNEAWDSLGISGLLKGGGAIGFYGLGQNAGLTMLLQALTATQAIGALVSLGLISAAALSGEIKQLVQAGRKVKGHPLAFIDELPS